MDQPTAPQYNTQYPPPPTKSGVPSWVWIVLAVGCGGIIVIVLFLAAIMFPVFSQARESAKSSLCMSNEKQMALGILMYTQDYDETLPTSAGWMDRMGPYVRNEQIFHCPSMVKDSGAYGYAFNSQESGVKMEKIQQPYATVMLFDSTTLTRNAADPMTSVPSTPRHRKGNNFAYADGHAHNSGQPPSPML